MFYKVAIVLIVVCLALIVVIVVRKFPQLTLIDAEALPKERETQKKKEIIHDRVGRLAAERWKTFVAKVSPVLAWLRAAFRRQYAKVLMLDRKYQAKKPAEKPLSTADIRDMADRMLDEAAGLVKEGRFDEAEKKYVEIIRLDARNLEAYRGLGDLYLDAKNYAQAKETYAFLVKMSVKQCCVAHKGRAGQEIDGVKEPAQCPASPAVQSEIAKNYFSLSAACRALGDLPGARLALESAVAHEPANPKHLDLLIDTCILEGDKDRALEVFEQLKSVNPENQKLGHLFEKIAAMPAKAGLNNSKKGK